MSLHLQRRNGLRGLPAALRRLALVVCAAALVAGCSSSGPDVPPGPSTGVPGTGAPTSQTGGGIGLIPPDSNTGTAPASVSNSGAPAVPAPPPAASLAWLSGPHDQIGVRIDTAGGERWQGPVPGEYALLDSTGYRWFGADGSMVGCTTTHACVAVDAEGHVAVTKEPSAPRAVYAVDGTFLGRFSAKGDKLSAGGSAPTLATALSDSGVDVAGLVNAATLAAPFAGGATGDPHVVTAAGVRFTSQVTGQYVARAGDPLHGIQLEFKPMSHRKDVSVISGVAIGAGHATVSVDMSGALLIDGSARPRPAEFEQITLSSGVAVGRWPADSDRVVTVAVVWPDGGSVVVGANPALGLTVVAHLPRVASAVGIFGAGGVGIGPDLLGRSGVVQDVGTALSSWLATRQELLFPVQVDPVSGFPEQTAVVDPVAQSSATQACAAGRITQAEDLSACVFDVALTGDTGFVRGHAELAIPVERGPVAAAFAARWPALLPGVVLGAPDLPAGGVIDATLDPGGSRAFRLVLTRRGSVGLVNHEGCGEGESSPGMGRAALRMFDAAGQAVSDRFPLCGHQQTPDLAPGVYTLLVANGPAGPALRVRVDVSLP